MQAIFTANDDLRKILVGWKRHKPRPHNIFRLVSDIYYRENFHSDVIGKLLDPETHPASMRLFIQLLNFRNSELRLNPDDYAYAQVKREPGKIDLFIKPPDKQCCIILENKINDATDQPGQLSGYLDTVQQRWSCKPEAIVYLSKDGEKPSERAFNKDNKAVVEKLLVCVAAFREGNGLVEKWLDPLLMELKQSDDDNELCHLITQYSDILTEIGMEMMNTENQNEFLELLKVESTFKEAELVADLFNRRIELALKKLADSYKDAKVRNKYPHIVRSEAGSSSGGFAQIQVKAGSDHIIQIWIHHTNGGIGLGIYKLVKNRSPQPISELFKNQFASISPLGVDDTIRFRWPEEEDKLYAVINGILDSCGHQGVGAL